MITKWGSLFLLIMTLPIMGHVIIQPLIFDVAGRDAWISVLLSLPGAFVFAYVVYHLRKKYPASNFQQTLYLLVGKFFGTLLLLPLFGYFLFISMLSLASLADMVNISFLPETPTWALAIWAMIFCLLAAKKGVKAISLTAGILSFIAMVTGHSVTLLSLPKKEWMHLKPILEFGWTPSILGAIVLTSIWTELLFLLVVPLNNPKEKHLFLCWCAGILLNGLMMLSTMTGSIMIFGMGLSDTFTYPALETVRILSLGFIDRFDIYGMILMTVGCYIRISFYFRLSYDLAAPYLANKTWLQQACFWSLGMGVLGLAIYVSSNHFRMEKFVIYYCYSIVLFMLPFFLLLIALVKDKKQHITNQIT